MNQQLLMALMQGAPAILSALKGAHMMPGETANIENALQNGADPGVMGDQFNEIAARRKSLTDGWDTPMSDTMNVYELNKLYDTAPQAFPSQSATTGDYLADLVGLAKTPEVQNAVSGTLTETPAAMLDWPLTNAMEASSGILPDADNIPAGYENYMSKLYGATKKYPAASSADTMLAALLDQVSKKAR